MVCVVAQAYVLSDIVDRVFQKKQTLNDVTSLLAVLLALACIRAAILWSGDVLAQRSASHLKGSLREKLVQHLFILGPAYTQSERSGEGGPRRRIPGRLADTAAGGAPLQR